MTTITEDMIQAAADSFPRSINRAEIINMLSAALRAMQAQEQSAATPHDISAKKAASSTDLASRATDAGSQEAGDPAADPPSPPEDALLAAPFQCTACDCLWRLNGDGSWSLSDEQQQPCSYCDNSPKFLSRLDPPISVVLARARDRIAADAIRLRDETARAADWNRAQLATADALDAAEAKAKLDHDCIINLGVLHGQEMARAQRTEAALRDFLAKYDEIEPILDDMFVLQFARTGRQYDGPSWEQEIKAMRAALAQLKPERK